MLSRALALWAIAGAFGAIIMSSSALASRPAPDSTAEPAAEIAAQPAPIRALLITGENNHNWRYTSRYHKDTLEASGRFAVDLTDDPSTTLAAHAHDYDVFVLDYNGSKRWSSEAESAFLKAVEDGKGVVFTHAANNAFAGLKADPAKDVAAQEPWPEYEKMCGYMWRQGAGHGAFHAFDVRFVDRDHPITKGLADFSKHPDELYHGLVNVHNVPVQLLATAFDSPEAKGSGKDEPMAMTLAYGKGRVFATPLGHVWEGAEDQKASIADPQFKTLLARGAEWAATGDVTLPTTWREAQAHNTLTPDEQAAGWKLLMDGKSASFRGYKKDKLPGSWKVDGGMLMLVPGLGGDNDRGDIVTLDQYQDFEFACDWKVDKAGNSGIMYRCTEDKTYPWETGPEMQILDNTGHPDGKKTQTSAGSLYDLLPAGYDVVRPAGEWNHAKIRVQGTKIEHWLNGFKVVECDLSSDAYKQAHARSKWTGMPDFATRSKGFIALQDHGDPVWFRNIKVRELK